MLQIVIPSLDLWDEAKEEFIVLPPVQLQLEHSLVSIAAWESKYHTPFLYKKELTADEVMDYIQFMTITENVSPETYLRLSEDNVKEIKEYIYNPMTATVFSKDFNGKRNREVVTAEIIYYWMVALNIPCEYQHWHLNRLLTLIKVCNIKNSPSKKRNLRDIIQRNEALNEMRKQKYNTSG